MLAQYPDLKDEYAEQFCTLFGEIRAKCESGEISTKALDLRGLIAAVKLIRNGLTAGQALEMGIVNKSTDDFERQIVADIVAVRISASLGAADVFEEK